MADNAQSGILTPSAREGAGRGMAVAFAGSLALHALAVLWLPGWRLPAAAPHTLALQVRLDDPAMSRPADRATQRDHSPAAALATVRRTPLRVSSAAAPAPVARALPPRAADEEGMEAPARTIAEPMSASLRDEAVAVVPHAEAGGPAVPRRDPAETAPPPAAAPAAGTVYNTVSLASPARDPGASPAMVIPQGNFTARGAVASIAPNPGSGQAGEPAAASAVGYLYNPRPEYPPAARRLHLEGHVLLHVLVDEAGRPDQVSVAHSSGIALLDDAALTKVRTWRFTPARTGDEAVPHWVDIPIRFRLDD